MERLTFKYTLVLITSDFTIAYDLHLLYISVYIDTVYTYTVRKRTPCVQTKYCVRSFIKMAWGMTQYTPCCVICYTWFSEWNQFWFYECTTTHSTMKHSKFPLLGKILFISPVWEILKICHWPLQNHSNWQKEMKH